MYRPVRVKRTLLHLETWHTYTRGANLTFHSDHPVCPLGKGKSTLVKLLIFTLCKHTF